MNTIFSIKTRSHDPFLTTQFLLAPKTGSCEHIKNDLPSNGSLILKKRVEIENALSSSDTLLERWKAPTIFAWSFWRQIEDSLLVLKNGSFEHTSNDLPTFSTEKWNLEIGPSEHLLPVFETKNWILKNGSWVWMGLNLGKYDWRLSSRLVPSSLAPRPTIGPRHGPNIPLIFHHQKVDGDVIPLTSLLWANKWLRIWK